MKGLLDLSEVRDADGDAPTLVFVGSTDNPVRDGSILEQSWKLKNYRKNPVFLDGHDYYNLPVGKALRVWKDTTGETRGEGEDEALVKGHRLLFRIAFVPEEIYPHAHRIYRMYQDGFMSAVSVGFRPERRDFTDEERKKYGIKNPWAEYLFNPELLELSSVTVPMDPDALKQGVDLGYASNVEEMLKVAQARREEIIASTQFQEAQAYFAELDYEDEPAPAPAPVQERIEINPAALAAIQEHTETLREYMALGAPVSSSAAPVEPTETHSDTPEGEADSGVAAGGEGDDDSSLVAELAKLDEELTTTEEVTD